MARKPKTLENGSAFEHLDTDGDGIITDEEMAKAREVAEFQHKQKLRRKRRQEGRSDSFNGMVCSLGYVAVSCNDSYHIIL